jgi:hypothetical protein
LSSRSQAEESDASDVKSGRILRDELSITYVPCLFGKTGLLQRVPAFSHLNQWTDFHETWYVYHITRDDCLPSLMEIWRP